MVDNKEYTEYIQNFLADTLVSIVRIERAAITIDRELAELPNWDSLAALQLLMHVENNFTVKIAPVRFFECTSIVEMASYLVSISGER